MTNLPVPVWAQEVPGNFLTGALWTQNIYNNGTFLTNPPFFIGRQNTVGSVPDGGWATIGLDTTQVDTYGGHSNTTNNSRYTAQVAGWYLVGGVVSFSNASTTGSRGARLSVNGTAIQGGASMGAAATLGSTIPTPTRGVFLNVNDYVELSGGQASGGAQNTNVGTDVCSALFVMWAHA